MPTQTTTRTRRKDTSKTRAIPDALSQFDSLPDSANVRLPVVAALFGCSGPTVWRRSKAGTLPKPRCLGGNITTWNVGELRAALKAAGGKHA